MAESSEISETAFPLAEEFIRTAKPVLEEVADGDLQALIGASTKLKDPAREGDAKTAEHVAYTLVAMTFDNMRVQLGGPFPTEADRQSTST